MADSAWDCPVCFMAYEDTSRRPSTLPCGHTFCDLCIDRIKEQGQVKCPTCCIQHVLPEAGQFPVNYALEDLIRSVRECSQDGPMELSRVTRFNLHDQEAKVLATISTCQARQVELDQYRTTLVDWNEWQQNIEDQLQELMDQSKGARLLVQQEESKVVDKKEQEQRREQQLHALLQTLRTVTTEEEVGIASADVARCINEERQREEECRGMFPDVPTVTTISEVREASSAILKAAMTVRTAQKTPGASANAPEDPDLPASLHSSITDRLKALQTPTLKVPRPLQAEDIRSLTQPARNLLQAGLVFAVHQEEGRSRHGRISLEDGHLYLYSLQDQPLPHNAVSIQMDEVVPATPPCLVFLDLAWPGSPPRRVLIQLSPDTPRGRQFLLLCTGQQGPCYAKTRLWKVGCKGVPGECVYGGDYEYNNGTGGAPLLSGLDKWQYQRSRRAGAVWGWREGPAKGARFSITTRDDNSFFGGVSGVFGEVVGGLEGVAVAAHQKPITEVIVVDCGVVLWAQGTTSSAACPAVPVIVHKTLMK